MSVPQRPANSEEGAGLTSPAPGMMKDPSPTRSMRMLSSDKQHTPMDVKDGQELRPSGSF